MSEEVDKTEEKRPAHRPLKYETVEKLERAIALYFKSCDPHWEYVKDWVPARDQDGSLKRDDDGQTYFEKLKVRRLTEQVPYTMSGLARSLGISRQTLVNYSEREDFLDSVEAAKTRCEEFWEGMLGTPASNGAKFNLTNNYEGWADKKELSGPGGKPMVALVEFVGDANPANSQD